MIPVSLLWKIIKMDPMDMKILQKMIEDLWNIFASFWVSTYTKLLGFGILVYLLCSLNRKTVSSLGKRDIDLTVPWSDGQVSQDAMALYPTLDSGGGTMADSGRPQGIE